ncbi:o-succinylbenzoate--CoA ligase [Halobaculum lipolyticum]|uniref:O-succinylbenzoate--CoA ligase n=1 Tax=Halobaculum lipolyticum TaxID=3032001 RepID=A0ABD5W9Y7_9EURY|nr:o-succinylbenzoate--CoA ligase [Halobaculum sp. DT31]
MRDWLSHRVAATPDAEALVLAASGESLTYADLDARATALASRLSGLGIAPGDHLAVVLDNRTEYVALIHAAMRLGVRLVPCSDRLTAAELRPKLATADATALVCGGETEAVAVEAALGDGTDGGATGWDTSDGFEPARVTDAEAGDADPVPVVSLDEPSDGRVVDVDAAPDGDVPTVRWGREDGLLMLFTSGSTGEPKLVQLTMGNVLASATASAFRLGVLPDDRYLATLSLHHTGGVLPIYRAVLYGTSVVLRAAFDAGGAVDDIRAYEVTGVSLVPTMLSRMLDARGTLPGCLRTVLLGGAPAPDELIERCRNYSVPVHPTWGMTEAASQLTTARSKEAFDRVGTVGRPLVWTDVAVRDDDGAALPAGETGELVVSGPTISPGYYGNPAATDAAYTDDGWFRTGDVGYRDEDGFVFVLNRLDDRIVSGGENVDPGEVTAALRAHPAVDDAAVVGVPDDEWGERVAALVVGDPDLTAGEVEAFCRERLAGFKIPRTIAFAEELPRTDSGSVRRPDVHDRLAAAAAAAAADDDADGDGNAAADTADDDGGAATTPADADGPTVDSAGERAADPADHADPADAAPGATDGAGAVEDAPDDGAPDDDEE